MLQITVYKCKHGAMWSVVSTDDHGQPNITTSSVIEGATQEEALHEAIKYIARSKKEVM